MSIKKIYSQIKIERSLHKAATTVKNAKLLYTFKTLAQKLQKKNSQKVPTKAKTKHFIQREKKNTSKEFVKKEKVVKQTECRNCYTVRFRWRQMHKRDDN